jgi:hypothetical protein
VGKRTDYSRSGGPWQNRLNLHRGVERESFFSLGERFPPYSSRYKSRRCCYLLKVLFQTEGALAIEVARDTGHVTRCPRGDGETSSWGLHRRPSSNAPREGRKEKKSRRRMMMMTMMKISAWRISGERLCIHLGRPTRSPRTPPSP